MSPDIDLKNIFEKMPKSLKIELLHYAEYLMSQSSEMRQSESQKQTQEQEDVKVKKPLAGSMKGTFVLPLAEDFDAPLEEFKDYM